jgi:hypothetical protein
MELPEECHDKNTLRKFSKKKKKVNNVRNVRKAIREGNS